MAFGKDHPGAPVPLLDRLVDLAPRQPAEPVPFRVLDREGLIASIERELSRIMNTRRPVPAEALGAWPRTVLDYGIPDFGKLGTSSQVDRRTMVAAIEDAIAAYEPRLTEVRVIIDPSDRTERSWRAVIEAMMVAGDIREPVAFPVVILAEGPTQVGAAPEVDEEAPLAGTG